MTVPLQNEKITIVGYVDAYDPETATIYDLKTTRFVKWQNEKGFLPKENHIAQVQCYASIFDEYGIQVNRLVLLYVDDKDIVAKQVPVGNRKQWMIQRASTLHKALKSTQLPEPEVSGSCKYCPFITLCPRQQEVLLTNATR
jgi:CRISPR/Cas system-associated exonuclease Cas4 (RecB family)